MTLTFPRTLSALFAASLLATSCLAQDYGNDWLNLTDAEFAEAYADMAFGDDLRDREVVAWMLFVRANQQIPFTPQPDDHTRVARTVPQWMAWATDADTFTARPSFVFNETPRDDPEFVAPKHELAGEVSLVDPDSANEEVTRNEVGYDYLTKTSGMNTYEGVLKYVRDGNNVQMPVGSIEIKASWLKVPDGGSAPGNAMTFEFDSGEWWFRGMHIMAKMRPAPVGTDLFYSEEPSWFWTTFEYNENPGVGHVRREFITQSEPLAPEEIEELLAAGNIGGLDYEHFAPNGTQIRYTVDGAGKEAVILGHTDMEDFAGYPAPSDPIAWSSFDASCHTCHATAAINPVTGNFFPFTVPIGTLSELYIGTGKTTMGCTGYSTALGDGYVPLDFMWPIAFQARPHGCPSAN